MHSLLWTHRVSWTRNILVGEIQHVPVITRPFFLQNPHNRFHLLVPDSQCIVQTGKTAERQNWFYRIHVFSTPEHFVIASVLQRAQIVLKCSTCCSKFWKLRSFQACSVLKYWKPRLVMMHHWWHLRYCQWRQRYNSDDSRVSGARQRRVTS